MLVIVLTLAAACVALADAPVRIVVAGKEVAVSPAPVLDGSRVLAPLEVLAALGASHIVSPDAKTLTVIPADGKPREIETVKVGTGRMVALDLLAAALDVGCDFDRSSRVLTLTAKLFSAEVVEDTLYVNLTAPAMCSAKLWENKLIVDIEGARLATESKEIYVGSPRIARARLGQYSEWTARVVLELEKSAAFRIQSEQPSSRISVKIVENAAPPEPQSPPKPIGPVMVESARIESAGNDGFDVVLATTGKCETTSLYGVRPPQVVVNVLGSKPGEGLKNVDASHSLLRGRGIRVMKEGATVRIEINLARVCAYEILSEEKELRISVSLPEHAGGGLAGKVVVIDAGHGGKDKGARCADVCEKDLNLKLAAEVGEVLTTLGMQVILCRPDDTFISLGDRPKAAADASADFFISLHCNSNIRPNSKSGIETYYHMQDPNARALAYAIQAGVCLFTGMKDLRARSDRSLYASGLAVLRGLKDTGIPGALLECGYINHSADRARLLDPEYRKKLAAGIAEGIAAYVQGTPIEQGRE